MFHPIFQNSTTVQESHNNQAQTATLPADAEGTSADVEYDVAIVGAGMGGLAASIFLRQAGLRVLCIEPKRFPHSPIGESLDWSAPALLQKLGISRDELVKEQVATYKWGVIVYPLTGKPFRTGTSPLLGCWPLRFEFLTCHVDRAQLDQKLFEIAQNLGVSFIWQRVSSIETHKERVSACQTTDGQRIGATWFIDASGRARLFAKAFEIGKSEYGCQKVCLWAHFENDSHSERTGFHVDHEAKYLSWIWEIHITPTKVSVGYITTAEKLRERRKSGQSVRQIFIEALIKHERFRELLTEQPDYELSSCSYRTYVNEYACGPNWFMVGEAACMPDPMTGNGVTAAIRHAESATRLIKEAAERLRAQQQQLYNTDILQLGDAFNRNIETALYELPIRQQLGPSSAMNVYVIFGYFANVLYSRFKPQSRFGLALFKGILLAMRLWIVSFSLIARFMSHSRRLLRSTVTRGIRADSILKKQQK